MHFPNRRLLNPKSNHKSPKTDKARTFAARSLSPTFVPSPRPLRLLVITYYWPPSGGAGVQRCLKFVKHLGTPSTTSSSAGSSRPPGTSGSGRRTTSSRRSAR